MNGKGVQIKLKKTLLPCPLNSLMVAFTVTTKICFKAFQVKEQDENAAHRGSISERLKVWKRYNNKTKIDIKITLVTDKKKSISNRKN